MFALPFYRWFAAYRASGFQYLIRDAAALFTQIRILIFCVAVWTSTNYISIWQKLVVKCAVELDYVLIINVAVFEQSFENILDKLDIFF